MLLSYFTEDAYERLLHEVDNNAQNYLLSDEWLNDYFGDEQFISSSSVDVNKFTPSYTAGAKSDAQKNEEDLINVRLMYDAFKNLTPLQASNKYMWTYLCHVIPEYKKYIIDRWLSSERTNTIKTRFFVTGSSSLFDNALSRLWWYGHFTYDSANKSNPYALTEVLLTSQTLCTDFIDTFNRMNPSRARGVLEALRDFNEMLEPNEGITDYFRACNKYLNRYAAVTTLDFLQPEEIKEITLGYLISTREEKRKKRTKEVVLSGAAV